MSFENPCKFCIGTQSQGEDCCIDVFIVLNTDECALFEKYNGYYWLKKDNGAIFYTKEGCPYLDNANQCTIHLKKPLYCKFYPIFLTGDPYVDDACPAHVLEDYKLSSEVLRQIKEIQQKYPIYEKEWLWKDIKKVIES
jgi:Fe-S-cluster containining protein